MHNVVSGWFGLSAIWLGVLAWRLVLSRLSDGGTWRGPGTLRTWIGALCVLLASGLLEAGVWSKLAPASDIDRVGRALLDALGYGGGIVAGLVGLCIGLPWLFGTRLSTLVFDLVGNTSRDPSEPAPRRAPVDREVRSTGSRLFGAAPPGSRSSRRRQSETTDTGLTDAFMDRPASSGLRAPGELGGKRRSPLSGVTAGRAAAQASTVASTLAKAQSNTQSVNRAAGQPVNHAPGRAASDAVPAHRPASLAPSSPTPSAATPAETKTRETSSPAGAGRSAHEISPGSIEATARQAAVAAARRAVSVASVPTVHASLPAGAVTSDSRPSARSLSETFRAVEEMASQWPALAGGARKPAARPQTAAKERTSAIQVATPAAIGGDVTEEKNDAFSMPPAIDTSIPLAIHAQPSDVGDAGSPIDLQTKAETSADVDASASMELNTQTHALPLAEPGTQFGVTAEIGAGTHAHVQASAESGSPLHASSDIKADSQAQVLANMGPDSPLHAQTNAVTDASTHAPANAEPHSPLHPLADAITDTPANAITDTSANVEPDPQLHAQTNAVTDAPALASGDVQTIAPIDTGLGKSFDTRFPMEASEALDPASEIVVNLTPHRPLLPPEDDIDVLDGMLPLSFASPAVSPATSPVTPPLPDVSPSSVESAVVSTPLSRFAPPANEPVMPGFTVQRAPVPSTALAGHPVTEFEFHQPSASYVELPGLDLLASASEFVEPASETHLAETGQLIEQRLKEFKVPVTVVGASAGPVITRFEVEPALGVRGAQIVGLMKDLSRGLGMTSIRVVETIPGKTCMGLELPNPKRQMIRLSEILASDAYRVSPSHLTIAMGKDITGTPVVTDLARAPHMLVAGTTGSGKSVAINAMILSLLFKARPADVRLIMIDPKMLELSVYEGIPHLLAPVVTDMKLAANALNWCVGEMEKRYRLMSALGVRNIAGFNQKLRDAARAERKIGNPFSLTPDAPEPLAPLPLIVVVIDELADLMMVAGKKIEELIARLAQKARASGIHLILATQRPSVDVITGLIKANIPTRVAFQVSSKIDSRTILDQMGAESLLGQGDMLFLPPGSGDPQRIHGAFVADDEVHRVVEYLKQFGEPEYEAAILDPGPGEGGAQADLFGEIPDPEADPLYDEAVAFVLRTRRASISSVQRQLRIGYNRAARLVEQMETAGLVSAMGVNGSREVLVAGPAE